MIGDVNHSTALLSLNNKVNVSNTNHTSNLFSVNVLFSGEMCNNVSGLTAGQIRICHLYKDHMIAVAIGARMAILECQHQFKYRRWNCSTVSDGTVFGPVVVLGTECLDPFAL